MNKYQRGFTVFELVACIVGFAGFAAFCFGVYALGHFVSKFW